MAGVKQTLYIKAEQNVEIATRDVTLGDVLSMECSDLHVVSKLKTIKLLKVPDEGRRRMVVSVLKIIECIHKEYPELDIQNMGTADIIITYEPENSKNKIVDVLKTGFVVITCFVGAAFAIMTFHNDSGITRLFGQIFEQFMGYPRQGFSILELSYSVGITIGILVFFNHFGKCKFTVDPTPLEIEMRLYEKDIQTTLIEDYSRKEKEFDVNKASSSGNHRP